VSGLRFYSKNVDENESGRVPAVLPNDPKIPPRKGTKDYDLWTGVIVREEIRIPFPYKIVYKDISKPRANSEELVEFKDDLEEQIAKKEMTPQKLRRIYYNLTASIKFQETNILRALAILEDRRLRDKSKFLLSQYEASFMRDCLKTMMTLRKKQSFVMTKFFEICDKI
jgi:hypothetical protein